MIHVDVIIYRSYGGPFQDIFVLYQDPVGKGFTAMLCRDNPEAAFPLGDRKNFLCIMVVNRFL